MLKLFSSCITHLVSIVCNGSTMQGEFELPTRLSVAAADCMLSLTLPLSKKDLDSDGSGLSDNKVKPTSKLLEVSNNMEMKMLLWDHLDELIILVERLLAWNRKSRSLHAKGLERVLKWLQGIKGHYVHVSNEAGSQALKTVVLLLCSCWKHYGMLMHLEDYKLSQHYKELVDQYLSGIQFYAEYTKEHAENIDNGIETIKFFLNCLSLLLGHFDGKQFENAISEYGLQISRVLIKQLHSPDEDVIDGAVCILKAVIFRTNCSLSRNIPTDTREMDALLPLLLHLLDERDGTSRAVVALIAEYCSVSTDERCLQEVLKRLAFGEVLQRRNAIDVISEIFHISPNPVNIYCRQDVANHLLECLGDEDLVIREQASNLIQMMEPSLVLPALVGLVYSSDEAVQSSARDTCLFVLKYNNKNYEVLSILVDCLSKLCQIPDLPEASGNKVKGGRNLDADRVLKLIPQWSKSVEDWNLLIEPLIDKMFSEPSNVIMVRLLSYISEQLADTADIVFQRLLFHIKQQNGLDTQSYEIDNTAKLEHSPFNRLCPLLIVKLLPLRVFNDINSPLNYGEFRNQGKGYLNIKDAEYECVAGTLLNRAFNKFEFEDVRKLAAELCGRIHPLVLFPVIASQLERATNAQDVLKIKACLFSLCTSLVVRGKDSILHPALLKIRNTIETVLLWPSLDGDEVSKAQHGCIDCLALIICTELHTPESFKDLTAKKTSLVGINSLKDAAMGNSLLSYVIHQLTCEKHEVASSAKMQTEDCKHDKSKSHSFRLCMGNVLISACQKISDSDKTHFAQKILPPLIQSVEVIMESDIRAACVQVFFSAVYYLKSAVLPHASDLLTVSLKSLKEGSEKEKLAGAKLLASLMASEEPVVESIATGLLAAKTVLSSISSSDPSPEVRLVSKQLLTCLTSV
ncbi:uncharacterized protein LOC127788461 isoform X2 [Diospyros lotus]|nr:uncharacterized protein LOC127788461 isoform X2 [Diospyros lotus]